MKTGEGRITTRTSGNRGYKSTWIYIPSDISKDKSFPFKDREKVLIELNDKKLIIRKSHNLDEITKKYNLKNATLAKLIEQRATEQKESSFIYFGDKVYSYQETNKIANRIAYGLINFVGNTKLKNPIVGLLFPNCPETLFCWLGLAKTNLLLIQIRHLLNTNLMEYVLENSKIQILMIDYQFFNEFKKIEKKLSGLKKVFIRNAPDGFKFKGLFANFQDIISDNEENPKLSIKDSDPLEVIYTAGTIGKPKGVLYRNYMTLSGISVGSILENFGFNSINHKIYCPIPLFQAFTKYFIIIPALFFNSSVIITKKFDASTFWDDIAKHNPDGFCYFSTFFLQLMNQEPTISDREHSLKYAFGFGAFKKQWEAFERRFGIHIIEGWSLAEGIGFTINKIGSEGGKTGSIGIPAKGFEVKIVDSSKNELPPGRNNIGEITARTKLPFKLEYYNLVEEPETSMGKNRWVYTGDYGYRDIDGYIYYLGRKSDMIKRDEEAFFAQDIERVANSHPLIINSTVFEIDIPNSSQKSIKIYAVRRGKNLLNYQEFHSFLKENLAYFMVPRFIEFREELPQNANGFVQKFILKEEWKNSASRRNTYDMESKQFIN
ncbi:MAG: hypothetical protein BAJALOKI2v1_460011 [Promethearchaeota archaeon]|nr:MAG: hypothetical protein BAJALOKI2v1_460011 [Candidatus Lokiarchaeota archaeon]